MVDRDGLENRCTGNRTEGSNPSLSAKYFHEKQRNFEMHRFYAAFSFKQAITLFVYTEILYNLMLIHKHV